jgi:acyl dehydratase
VCAGDPERLRRLAVRFSRPVLPGQEITTRLYAAGRDQGEVHFGFETLNAEGQAVIKDGRAEVAS